MKCGDSGQVLDKVGAPGRIRICDLCLRRAALYPAELRVHRLASQSYSGWRGGKAIASAWMPKAAGRPRARTMSRRPAWNETIPRTPSVSGELGNQQKGFVDAVKHTKLYSLRRDFQDRRRWAAARTVLHRSKRELNPHCTAATCDTCSQASKVIHAAPCACAA
jgi:hypothetical protein